MRFKPWIPRAAFKISLGEQSRLFLVVTGLIGSAYARFVLKLCRIKLEGRERLIEEYRLSVADKSRFIIAYRHPGDADPHLVYHMLTNLLRSDAPATAPDGRPGAWYPSGTEVQLWASPLILWALKNAGIVPVRHGGVDRTVMDFLVQGVAHRKRPMAIAPEGQSTYHQNLLPELDPGTVRIAMLASERLASEGTPLPVRIVPLSIDYRYGRTTTPTHLDRFIARLERRVARPGESLPARSGDREAIQARLMAIWERLVSATESAYARAWGIKSAPVGANLCERTLTLIDQSIARLEGFYGVVPAGNLKARILNIRAESLRRVFYEAGELAAFSSLEQGMANRGSAEAYFLDQVYLVAGLGQFLDPAYIDGESSFDRLVETAQNLFDYANRLEGMNMGHRPRPFLKDATLIVGKPIDVARGPGENRRQAADRLQRELEDGLKTLIRG